MRVEDSFLVVAALESYRNLLDSEGNENSNDIYTLSY
jgi:hypothetical protein